jgi:hypothetical protein
MDDLRSAALRNTASVSRSYSAIGASCPARDIPARSLAVAMAARSRVHDNRPAKPHAHDAVAGVRKGGRHDRAHEIWVRSKTNRPNQTSVPRSSARSGGSSKPYGQRRNSALVARHVNDYGSDVVGAAVIIGQIG